VSRGRIEAFGRIEPLVVRLGPINPADPQIRLPVKPHSFAQRIDETSRTIRAPKSTSHIASEYQTSNFSSASHRRRLMMSRGQRRRTMIVGRRGFSKSAPPSEIHQEF